MCTDCGCQQANAAQATQDQPPQTKTLHLETNILEKNNAIAHRNRHWLDDHGVTAINVMSSPGSGKTALLEKTVGRLEENQKVSILVGDQQTERDADRLRKAGAVVKQINTHSSCHLDARHVERELGTYVDGSEDLLIIENVGNLVCPAAFDLGEALKVALLSVTEGEDKPIKYPVLFHSADLVIITKTDLIPHLDWNREEALKCIRQVNPHARIIELSARTGEGMEGWYAFLTQ